MYKKYYLLISLFFFGFMTALPQKVFAFCRTTTNKDFVPTMSKPCDTTPTSKPIFWSGKCAGFSVQKEASVQVNFEVARDIVAHSFATWSSASCPFGITGESTQCPAGNGAGNPSISVQDLGPVTCNQVEYNIDRSNSNSIIFRDGQWPHSTVDGILGLTTVTFNIDTGEIYDADMEIQSNPNEIKLTTVDPPQRIEYDVQSIVTHEAGHFLGLSHTQTVNSSATMFAFYQRGTIGMRTLEQDDVCGICAIYPPNRSSSCDPTPRRGLTDVCGGTKPNGCNCSLFAFSQKSSYSIGVALFVVCFGLMGIRRAKTKHASDR